MAIPLRAVGFALALLALGACGRTGLKVDRGSLDSGIPRDAIADAPIDAPGRRDAMVLPPLPAPFLDIRAGRDHACALDETGRVVCWGDNRHRELALGDAPDSLVPVPIELPSIVAIDVGANLSCALDVDDAVWCWGSLPLLSGGAPVPTRISGFTRMQGASAGSGWACMLSRIGAVSCVGGRTMDASREVVARGARALALGSLHGCALVGPDVFCFGNNGSGQLGVPVSHPFGGDLLTATVPGVRDAVSIASGFGHSCAATADGSVYCWGSNHDGQLGFEPVGTDIRATRVPGLDGVDTVEAGWGVSCALRRGELWCWGDGSLGQLGGGPAFPPQPPTRVDLVEPVRSVSAGIDFTCAVDGDGRPWCWGQNTRGQLGDGTREDRYYPVPVAL